MGTRTASGVNQAVEEIPRGAAFLHYLDAGYDPFEAGRQVRLGQLDYSGIGRTKWERNVGSRWVFFWQFARRSPKAVLQAIATHPGLAIALEKTPFGANIESERNQYGDVVGVSVDTPAAGLAGDLFSAFKDHRKFLLDKTIPAAQYVAGSDRRRDTKLGPVGELVPPAAAMERMLRNLSDPQRRDEELLKQTTGLRTGKSDEEIEEERRARR